MSPKGDALAAAVEARFGLSLLPSLRDSLARMSRELVSEGLAQSEAELLRRLEKAAETDPVVVRLRAAASIGETYFFRAPEQLHAVVAALQTRVLPVKKQRAEQSLRVWSAGCATGEEAYSIAILLRRAAPELKLSVLGTDMNDASLVTAEQARYGPRAFRRSKPEAFSEAFVQRGEVREVAKGIRSCVRFRRLNLVTEALPPEESGFDLVLCRNVLMYLDAQKLPRVIQRMARACARPSVVALTPAEHAAGRMLGDFERLPHALFSRSAADLPVKTELARTPARAPPEHKTQAVGIASFDADLQAALAAADAGRFEGAETLLESAERARPEAPQPPYVKALVAQAQQSPREALRHFRRSLFLDRTFLPAILGLADLLLRQGNPSEAFGLYARALRLLDGKPDDALIDLSDIRVGVARRWAEQGKADAEGSR